MLSLLLMPRIHVSLPIFVKTIFTFHEHTTFNYIGITKESIPKLTRPQQLAEKLSI
jgi:hypothetical protein